MGAILRDGEWREGWFLRRAALTASVVMFAIGAAFLIDVARPESIGYPDSIATAGGLLLSATVFLLSFAQNDHRHALTTAVREVRARDAALVKAGSHDDPDPWPPRMYRELEHVATMSALSRLSPHALQRRAYLWGLWQREWDREWASSLWSGNEEERRRHSSARRRIEKRLQTQLLNEMGRQSTWGDRLSLAMPSPRPEPSAQQFEHELAVQSRALATAYLLLGAMIALTLVGVAFVDDPLSWPPDPSWWGGVILVGVAFVYVDRVKDGMRATGAAAAQRMHHSALPILQWLQIILLDGNINDARREAIDEHLEALANAADLPMVQRLRGEYRLAKAFRSLPRVNTEKPKIVHFEESREWWFSDVGKEESQNHPERSKEQIRRTLYHIDAAVSHLERGAQAHDDPIALTALAGALDAKNAFLGKPAPERVRQLLESAVTVFEKIEAGPYKLDVGALLYGHRWLWPRDADVLERSLAKKARPDGLQ
ncbi:hypothetical protein FND50_33185 [Rhodococcus sp. WB9]|nr:hypothetical protein FND50_33185 [Rhodococcus sp. WB9]